MSNAKNKKTHNYGRPRFSLDTETGEIKYNGGAFAKINFVSLGAFQRPAKEMIRLANMADTMEFESGKDPEYI